MSARCHKIYVKSWDDYGYFHLWIKFSSTTLSLDINTVLFFIYKFLPHVDTYNREVCVKCMRHLDIPVEITHKPLLMVSVRYDSLNCCFQFSFLFSHGYLTINHNSVGFESGLLIFCSCSLSVFRSGSVNIPQVPLAKPPLTHPSPLQEHSHSFLMFLMFGLPLHWLMRRHMAVVLLPNASKVLRSKRQSKPLT